MTRKTLTTIISAIMLSLGINTVAQESETKPAFSGNYNSLLTTKNLPFGYHVGKGPHIQNTLSLGYKDFKAFMWSDYDFGNQNTVENDYGIAYSKKVQDISIDASYAYWSYPKNGEDNVATLSISHSGKIDKKVSFFYFFRKKDAPAACAVNMMASKTFNISDNVTLTSNVELTYLNNTLGGDKGISKLSSKTDVKYTHNNYDISAFIGAQKGFIEKTASGMPLSDAVYGGINLSVNF